MAFTVVHAVSLLVFLGAVGGATYGVQMIVGDSVQASLLGIDPAHDARAAAPGHEVTFPITLRNRGDEAREVKVEVATSGFSGATPLAQVGPEGAATVFLTVAVPADAAPGDRALTVRLVDAHGATLREAEALRLTVLGDAPAFDETDSATIVYTGRMLESGRVFYSNDPALAPLASSFAHVGDYKPGSAPIKVVTQPAPSVIDGLMRGLLGMREGESRAITVTPEDGFGPAVLTEERARTESVERNRTLPVREQTAPLASFVKHIQDTSQGDPSTYDAGDTFTINDRSGKALRYLIVQKSDANLTYRFSPPVGERITLYAPWPDGTEIVEVTNTSILARTTPTTEEGASFTWHDFWPEMTSVAAIEEDTIVLRHTPPVGASHEEEDPMSGAARLYTVTEVGEDKILLSYPSSNPLAGQTLVFDVTIATLTKA